MIDGSVLRYLRKRSKLTLAEVSGVNSAYLSEIERGKQVPKLDTLERILGSYGYKLRVIAYRSSESGELIYKLR